MIMIIIIYIFIIIIIYIKVVFACILVVLGCFDIFKCYVQKQFYLQVA